MRCQCGRSRDLYLKLDGILVSLDLFLLAIVFGASYLTPTASEDARAAARVSRRIRVYVHGRFSPEFESIPRAYNTSIDIYRQNVFSFPRARSRSSSRSRSRKIMSRKQDLLGASTAVNSPWQSCVHRPFLLAEFKTPLKHMAGTASDRYCNFKHSAPKSGSKTIDRRRETHVSRQAKEL